MLMSADQVTTVEARKEFGRLVDAAHYSGDATVITKNGEPRAVLVSYEWYQDAVKIKGQVVGQTSENR